MFQISTSDTTGSKVDLNIRFEYLHKRKQHHTICIVENAETREIQAVGKTRCHTKCDVFDKNTGREKSMDRALKSCSFLNRESRSLIWNEYNRTRVFGARKWKVSKK